MCGLVQGEELTHRVGEKLQELGRILVPHFLGDGSSGRGLAAAFARGIPFMPAEQEVAHTAICDLT